NDDAADESVARHSGIAGESVIAAGHDRDGGLVDESVTKKAPAEIDQDDVAGLGVGGGGRQDADDVAWGGEGAHATAAERQVYGVTSAQQLGRHLRANWRARDHAGPPSRSSSVRAASGPLRLR